MCSTRPLLSAYFHNMRSVPDATLSGDRRSDGMDPEPNSDKLSKLMLFVIGSPAQFRDPFRSLSKVNLSGSQNANRNAAAAAEKTE